MMMMTLYKCDLKMIHNNTFKKYWNWSQTIKTIRDKVVDVSPKLWEHARSIEVERTIDPVERDQEHQDDQDAQGLEESSLLPPVL